jgi:hypothetical protein
MTGAQVRERVPDWVIRTRHRRRSRRAPRSGQSRCRGVS